jgi:hypothetical protein
VSYKEGAMTEKVVDPCPQFTLNASIEELEHQPVNPHRVKGFGYIKKTNRNRSVGLDFGPGDGSNGGDDEEEEMGGGVAFSKPSLKRVQETWK